jgi:peptidyl-dipeptidase Dcp
VDWFTENGGMTRANGERFRRELLSRGNSRDPLDSFRTLRGREARLEPLLKRRGLD